MFRVGKNVVVVVLLIRMKSMRIVVKGFVDCILKRVFCSVCLRVDVVVMLIEVERLVNRMVFLMIFWKMLVLVKLSDCFMVYFCECVCVLVVMIL